MPAGGGTQAPSSSGDQGNLSLGSFAAFIPCGKMPICGLGHQAILFS